ncbi:MAG: hypothetical protein HRT68_10765, partial [Flavobacteriaceae bacterium]|nr:hypothetical protein [Flavobacteriaceae bacterium]
MNYNRNQFINDIYSGNNIEVFWFQYNQFCQDLKNIEIETIIEINSVLIERVKKENQSTHRYYQNISDRCSKDVPFAKEVYLRFYNNESPEFQNALNYIISGLFKIDNDLAIKKTKQLIKNPNTKKIIQGIYSIANFDFSQNQNSSFLKYIDEEFRKLIKSNTLIDVLKALLFASGKLYKYSTKFDKHVNQLKDLYEIEIKKQLIEFLYYDLDI